MGEQHTVTTALCFTIICLVVIVQGRILRDAPADQGESLTTFRVARITRQSSHSGHNMELHLTGIDADLPTAYMITARYAEPRHLGKPSNGIIRFHMESGRATITFVHPRGYQRITLHPSEGSFVEQALPRLDFTIREGRQLVFQQGQDTDVHARLSVVSNEQAYLGDNNMYAHVAVKSTTEDHAVDIHDEYDQFPVFVLNKTISHNVISSHLSINTSAGNVEGLVQLSAFTAMGCMSPETCISGHYYIQEDLTLYEDGHDGPFPDNYIGYVIDHYTPNPIRCYVDEPRLCIIRCGFIGDKPTPVQFERVSGVNVGPFKQWSLVESEFRVLGMLVFTSVTSPGEAQYRCTSSSGQQQASRTIRVEAVIPPWRQRG